MGRPRECPQFDRAEAPARSAPTMQLRGALAAGVVLALACGSVLAACGGGGGGGGGEAGKPVTLKVGVIPIADVAPLYVGIDKGFFKQEKLTIKPQLAEGGAAIVPSVVSGDSQIGFSNTTSLIIARSKKLPLRIISQGDIGGTSAKDAPDGLLVAKNSSIKSPKDLEGKTVAVNTLQNVGPLTISRALEKRGVDYTKVKYVEVPFPEMGAALGAGRVDATWVVEPFVTQGKAAGSRVLLNPFEETAKSLTVATYFTTERYIQQSRDVVDRFVRAMNKSLEYADSHPQDVRKTVLGYTKIPPKAAQAMTLPQWGKELNEPTIQTTAQLAKKYGFVKQAPSLDDLILRH
jgi:NitT/TauT family transport system substrate-binding protein